MKSSKMVRTLQLYAIASVVGVGLIALLMVTLVTTSAAASGAAQPLSPRRRRPAQ